MVFCHLAKRKPFRGTHYTILCSVVWRNTIQNRIVCRQPYTSLTFKKEMDNIRFKANIPSRNGKDSPLIRDEVVGIDKKEPDISL